MADGWYSRHPSECYVLRAFAPLREKMSCRDTGNL